MYQPATTKPRRPAVVTLAAVLLGLVALLDLAAAVVGFAAMNRTVEQFRQLLQDQDLTGSEIDALTTSTRVAFIVFGVALIVWAIVLMLLMWGLLRGSQAARVMTWIACALGVICSCCGGISAFGGMGSTEMTGSGNYDAVTALPDWASALFAGSSVLKLLGYIAIAVLLALPAAHAFFRRGRPPGAQPPPGPATPPPSYPPPDQHPSHPAPPTSPPSNL